MPSKVQALAPKKAQRFETLAQRYAEAAANNDEARMAAALEAIQKLRAATRARPSRGSPAPKPRMGTPQQSAALEKWKANEFAKLEKEVLLDPVELAKRKQAIEDSYGQQLQALGGTWKRTVYAPSSNPYLE